MTGKNNTRLLRLVSLLLIAALSVMLCACGQKAEDASAEKQEYIGIISAMDNEVSLLLENAEIDHVDTIGKVDYHVGTLCGRPVVIARSGIGMVLASSAMTAMLNNYDISKVIFTGVAGGVGDETRVLDEVIGERLVMHDYGMMTDEGIVWSYGNTGEEIGDDGYFYSDPELVQLAYDAAVKVVGEEYAFKGTIASGDQFVSSEEYVRILQDNFDALACEMEGAAVAAVCRQYDTPFVVVRALSDKADGKAAETYENFGDTAADNSSRIVMDMLDSM